MADQHKVAGNAAFKEGRYDQAAQHFTAAIKLDPNSAVLYSNRSGAHTSLGNYTDALADSERVVGLSPEWAKGYSRKAAALYGLGRCVSRNREALATLSPTEISCMPLRRYADSVAAFESGLRLDPSNAQMAQALTDVSAKLAAARDLYDAAAAGDLASVRRALQARTHPDGYAAEDGSTALIAAARGNAAEVVRDLLAAGARPASRTRGGETALGVAKKVGHEAVARLLPPEDKPPFGALFGAAAKLAGGVSAAARELAEKKILPSAMQLGAGAELRRSGVSPAGALGLAAAAAPAGVGVHDDERRARAEVERAEAEEAAEKRAIESSLQTRAEEERRAVAAETLRAEHEVLYVVDRIPPSSNWLRLTSSLTLNPTRARVNPQCTTSPRPPFCLSYTIKYWS